MKRLALIFLISVSLHAQAQLTINGKNINDDKTIEYIQLSFYYESKTLSPVYAIDFGYAISETAGLTPQKISVDNEEITGKFTPAYVLNRLHKAGWTYLGDVVFMAAPMVPNTQTYTFKRIPETSSKK